MIRAALAIVAAGVALGLAGPAPSLGQDAQVMCFPADALLRSLRDRRGQVVVAGGVSATGRAFQILAAGDGAFTVVVVGPEGMLCPMLVGTGFAFAPAAAPAGDPS